MITNCQASDDPQLAAIEMEAVQSMNKRSKADKTYHLLVSFRAGEEPDEKTMRTIEKEMCAALGYSEHQRIAVIHQDTDNTHMHIAINKVHPDTHKLHDPFFDFYKQKKAREKLEKQFSLCIDTKEASDEQQQTGSTEAQDMEAFSAVESLESWIRRECMEDIKKAETWEDLHRTLAENGLAIIKRGNGLVFKVATGDDTTPVKASSIDRMFSKKNIEKKYGEFIPPSDSVATVAATRQYAKSPAPSANPEAMSLYEEYQRVRNAYENRQSAELAELNKEYNRRATAAKELHKAETKAMRAGRWSPAVKLKLEAEKLKHGKHMAELRKEFGEKRMKVYVECGRCTYPVWLQSQAEAGREDAVKALRARAHNLNKKLNAPAITGEKHEDAPVLEDAPIDKVTKKGTVMYQVGDEIVRHDADGYTVSKTSDIETTIMALKMAQKRYGDKLTITGSKDFKSKVIAAAVDAHMKITFTDKWMEDARQRLLEQRKEEQKRQDQQQREAARQQNAAEQKQKEDPQKQKEGMSR